MENFFCAVNGKQTLLQGFFSSVFSFNKAETYSKPNQTPNLERFAKTINSF